MERLIAIFTTRDVFDRAIDSIAAEFGTVTSIDARMSALINCIAV